MKSASLSIKLIHKMDKLKRDGTAPIYVRVRYNRAKLELSTNQNVQSTQWNHLEQKVIKHPQAKAINQFLTAFLTKIQNAYSQLFIAREEVTLEAIKQLVMGKSVTTRHELLQVTQEHNNNFKSLIGVKYSQGSYKNYKTTMKYLLEFVPEYSGKQDIPLELVNYKFCETYYSFLTTRKNCRTNGANKQLQRLKKVINYAIRHGYIQSNPMVTYTLEFEPVSKVALTMDELKRLIELDLQTKTLENVRNIFLIQCFTGLPYSDVKRLSYKDIGEGEGGTLWIRMNRQKTKTSFKVPLLEQAKALLSVYLTNSNSDEPILPVLSNQKMNQNLKILQELASIKKSLTTHLGRHTFATTITLNNDVPIETVSSMLGHTKLSTTQVYAKVLESKLGKDMERLQQRLGSE